MSLVTQITAAFQAVATAMGKEQDWATSFTSKITSPTGAQVASNSVPGIVQLATAAEVAAGTDDIKAVTSAQLTTFLNSAERMKVYRVSTLAALNAIATTAADGAIAQMTDAPAGTNGVTINTATWVKRAGIFYIVSGIYCGYPGSYTLGDASAASEIAVAITSQSKLSIPIFAEIMLGTRFRYNNSKFVQISGVAPVTYQNGYSQWDPDGTTPGWTTRLERNGRFVTARFAIRTTTTTRGTLAIGEIMLNTPVGFRPQNNVQVTLATYNGSSGGWNGLASAEMQPNGNLFVDYSSIAASSVQALFGNVTYEAAD